MDLEEAEEEVETLVEEEEGPIEDEEEIEDQVNDVEFAKRALVKRKIAGTKASHNVTIIKSSGTCKRIVILATSSTFHLQKQKIMKTTYSLLVKKQLKNMKMYGIYTAVAAII